MSRDHRSTHPLHHSYLGFNYVCAEFNHLHWDFWYQIISSYFRVAFSFRKSSSFRLDKTCSVCSKGKHQSHKRLRIIDFFQWHMLPKTLTFHHLAFSRKIDWPSIQLGWPAQVSRITSEKESFKIQAAWNMNMFVLGLTP